MVIGAGLAGLTAGAKLASEGKRVVVLEAHARPGGCATTYRRKGYEVEVSLHVVDGFDEHDCKGPIFDDLGVSDDLEFVPAPGEVYRYLSGDDVFDMPVGLEEAIDALSARHPDERRELTRVLGTMAKVRHELSSFPLSPKAVARRGPFFPFLYPNLMFALRGSLGEFLDKRFASEELKLLLTANLSLFHDDPYSISARYFSVAQAAFIESGTYYLKGGSQRLSNRLRKVIEDAGGEVRCNHRVTRIHTEGKRVSSVEYVHKGRTGRAMGKQVLANAAVPQVRDQLLAPGADPGLEKRTKDMELGSSVVALYVGFKKPLRELGHRTYTTMQYDPSVRTLADIPKNIHGPYAQRICGFTDYSQLDSGLAPPGKGLAALCVLDRMEAWDGLSDTEYAEKKAEVTEAFLDRIEAMVPGSKQHVEWTELGTPRTVRHYTLNTDGSISGFAQGTSQTLMRRFARVRSSLKNLHFAGAWQFPGGGYTCAILGGYLQAVHLIEQRMV
ncbi:MAG: NAD(P)/FAD-dependent oxidoreductase [Myxococcota bacterium]